MSGLNEALKVLKQRVKKTFVFFMTNSTLTSLAGYTQLTPYSQLCKVSCYYC